MSKTSGQLRVAQILLESAQFAHREDYLDLSADTKIEIGKVSIQLEVGFPETDEQSALVRMAVSSPPEAVYQFDCRLLLIGTYESAEIDRAKVADGLVRTGGTILFPFAREAIANLTGRGRFGALWLQPINVAKLLEGAKVLNSASQGANKAETPGPAAATPRRKPKRRKAAE